MTIEEVGQSAVYFLSDMSRGVTGEISHVDAGYHIVGMKNPEAPIFRSIKTRRNPTCRPLSPSASLSWRAPA